MTSPSMTVHDVARYLNVDEKTVYRLAQRGELPGFKVAGTWRFKKDDIDAWIERRKLATRDERGAAAPTETPGRKDAK
ncbi:MAG: helix-turn-helix domain-containing protein [Myxococcales bacterium]|nr:helix-turn-helix domain-containing protein [Myxococcales bacterium]